jgi:hypothetical protein
VWCSPSHDRRCFIAIELVLALPGTQDSRHSHAPSKSISRGVRAYLLALDRIRCLPNDGGACVCVTAIQLPKRLRRGSHSPTVLTSMFTTPHTHTQPTMAENYYTGVKPITAEDVKTVRKTYPKLCLPTMAHAHTRSPFAGDVAKHCMVHTVV